MFHVPASRRWRRPSPALIIALLALCISCVTSAWAAVRVTSSNIVNGSVRSVDIQNSGVRTVDLHVTARYRPGTWINVASPGGAEFGPAWSDYPGYQPVSYRKDSHGYVYLRGAMQNAGGNVGSGTAFTLPAGYRPANYETFAVASTDGASGANAVDSMIDVADDGSIYVFGDVDDRYVSRSGISFRAAS
jgi:hypothetical protein